MIPTWAPHCECWVKQRLWTLVFQMIPFVRNDEMGRVGVDKSQLGPLWIRKLEVHHG